MSTTSDRWLARLRRGRRRQVLVGFQPRLVVAQLVWTAGSLVLFVLLVLAPTLVGLNAAADHERLQAATLLLHLHHRVWIPLAAMAAMLTVGAIAVSHRVAGPLYRFRSVFDAVANGHLGVTARIRAGDYPVDESAALQRMLVVLRDRIAEAQEGVQAAADAGCLEEARAAIARVQLVLALFEVTPPSAAAPVRTISGTPASGPTRRNGDGGFTVFELLVTMALVSVLAAMGVPRYLDALETARVTRAVGDIRNVGQAIMVHQTLSGCLPSSLADIDQGHLIDPWGQPYVYQVLASPGGGDGNGGGSKKKGAAGGGGGAAGGTCGACGGGCVNQGQARKDRNLVPINSDYDFFSMGKDGKSSSPLTAPGSQDDIIRASDGGFIGLARDY